MTSRREQYRADIKADAKRIAMDQLAESGPAGVSVNAIAKRMGVTGPALYRYFASRDDLLGELIADAYEDLASTVEAVETPDPAERLLAMADEFRSWALAAPHRYLLLFGTPVPGYRAPESTVDSAQRALIAFARVFAALPNGPTTVELDAQLADWLTARAESVPPSAFRRALVGWTRMHGILSLEVEGQFSLMGFDPALLYRTEVESLLVRSLGRV